MEVIFWTFWLLFAAAIVGMAFSALGAYMTDDNVRQWRGWLLFFAFAGAMLAYLMMAFRTSYELRSDSIKVLFGQWYLYVYLLPLLVGSFAMSATYDLIDVFVSMLLTVGFAVSLMFASWVPSQGGEHHVVQLVLLICAAGGFLVALALWMMQLVIGWSPLNWFKERTTAAPGLEKVQNKFWYGVTAILMGVLFCGYVLVAALGPSGRKVFGSVSRSQFVQTLVLLAIDLALGVVSLLAYFYLSQNGDVGLAAPLDMLQQRSTSGSPTRGKYQAGVQGSGFDMDA